MNSEMVVKVNSNCGSKLSIDHSVEWKEHIAARGRSNFVLYVSIAQTAEQGNPEPAMSKQLISQPCVDQPRNLILLFFYDIRIQHLEDISGDNVTYNVMDNAVTFEVIIDNRPR